MKRTIVILFLVAAVGFMNSCGKIEKKFIPTYGAQVTGNGAEFRIHAPRSEKVFLVIFEKAEDNTGREYLMEKTDNGDWKYFLNGGDYGTLYGYRLEGPAGINENDVIIADPYTQAAVTQNTYRHVAKSLIVKQDFDWKGDTWIARDPKDLVISEIHVRDMTAGQNSGSKNPGTYLGLVESGQTGGIEHIKDMGFNAVQILPAQDFANVEVPYLDSNATIFNTWNPYARNHWGYMTTFFFAPETYYSSSGTMKPGAWNGADGKAIPEFKEMVRRFHEDNISVIMDVVYNHVSNYDWHPLKFIDKDLYFRLNEDGSYIALSGCGNDTRSESYAMRQLILESLKFWMIEYHIDGFRFDLGNLIDETTRKMILKELRKINPNVIILAEPWGDGYDPEGFSDIGWASFNDKIRNGVKGQNPNDSHGFIFGHWQGNNTPEALRNYAMGSLRKFGGQYIDVSHSVNYLESHDDHTFGDFVRIGLGAARENRKIRSRSQNAKIRGQALAVNKLGALFLMTSQGVTFTHQGQSWARSKVIAEADVPDKKIGFIDHNSYEKDNETNWLNWNEKTRNSELVNYYRGLIRIRNNNEEFRHSTPEDFDFLDTGDKVAIAYVLKNKFLVVMNGMREDHLDLNLPEGKWMILADRITVDEAGLGVVEGRISVNVSSGMILKRVL